MLARGAAAELGKRLKKGDIMTANEADNARIGALLAEVVRISRSARREDPNSLRQCFYEYVQYCIENNMRISNMTAYAAMGINNNVAKTWRNGQQRTHEYQALIEEVDRVCGVYRDMLATENKINVAWAIFCASNYDGMMNDGGVSQALPPPPDAMGERVDSEAINAKWREALPDEEKPKEE